MANRYPPSYTILSAERVELVRLALIHYQEELRAECRDLLDSSCYELCKLKIDLMKSNKALIEDIDKNIEFDDSDDLVGCIDV